MANEKRLDLIDRNALMDSHWWNGMKDPFDKARAKIIIQSAKTVDAVEVVHGRWRLETDEEEPNLMFKLVVCSVCGKTANGMYNYCPNCGANMVDGGNENGK